MANQDSYLKQLPFGAPGSLSRPHVHTVEAQMVNKTTPPNIYGGGVKMVSGLALAIAAADPVTVFYGFLVRPWPSQDNSVGGNTYGSATPPAFGTCDILVRGYLLVNVGAGTPAPGGIVYMRVATPAAGKPIGGIEAVADSTNTVIVPNAIFMTAMDENGTAEVRYNI